MILFLSHLYPEGHRLCLLPSQLRVQPKGFSCIWAKTNNMIQLHWIHSLFSCLTPHQFWNICIPTPLPPMHKTTRVTTNNIYMLGALVSICQSSSVYYFAWQLFPWKEISQVRKTEAYFTVLILQSFRNLKANTLRRIVFKKILWTLS